MFNKLSRSLLYKRARFLVRFRRLINKRLAADLKGNISFVTEHKENSVYKENTVYVHPKAGHGSAF